MPQSRLPVGKILIGAFYIPGTLRGPLLRQTGWPLLILALTESYMSFALDDPGWWIIPKSSVDRFVQEVSQRYVTGIDLVALGAVFVAR